MRFSERHEGSALPTRRDDSLFLSMHLPGVLCFLFSIRHVPKYTGRRMGYCMLSRAICLHSWQFEPVVPLLWGGGRSGFREWRFFARRIFFGWLGTFMTAHFTVDGWQQCAAALSKQASHDRIDSTCIGGDFEYMYATVLQQMCDRGNDALF